MYNNGGKMSEFREGSPEWFVEDMYWSFSEFENLTTDEVKLCCDKTLNYLYKSADTVMKTYYEECIKINKRR